MLSNAQSAMLRKAIVKDFVMPHGGSEYKTANALVRKGMMHVGANGAYFITDKGREMIR